MKKSNTDKLRQTITDAIIKQLESVDPKDYKKSWFNIGSLPMNAVTKNSYQGINTLWLGMSGYNRLIFATFKQWQSIGCKVKKGSKGYPVVLKIYSPDITHKSDVGGVALNIKTEISLRSFYGKRTV